MLPQIVPWNALGEVAEALEAAIARLEPDAVAADPQQDALRDAAARASDIAARCRDQAAPELGDVAATIARALLLIAQGDVEPHHAQWQMAAAIHAIRQAIAQLIAGASYSPVALAGAQFELETLFPLPDGRRAGDPPGAVVPASSLVRRLT